MAQPSGLKSQSYIQSQPPIMSRYGSPSVGPITSHSQQPMPSQQMQSSTMLHNQQQYYSSQQMQRPMQTQSTPSTMSQAKQLDPDMMPSVVQVIEEDMAKHKNDHGMFLTTKPITVPPLVTTLNGQEKIIIQDGGCARPNHFRATVYMVPVNEDVLKTANIPFGFVIKPFDEEELEDSFVSKTKCTLEYVKKICFYFNLTFRWFRFLIVR